MQGFPVGLAMAEAVLLPVGPPPCRTRSKADQAVGQTEAWVGVSSTFTKARAGLIGPNGAGKTTLLD